MRVEPEGLNVELDSGFDVRHCLFVGRTIPNDHTLDSQWVSNVTVGVFFNDDLDLTHGGLLLPKFTTESEFNELGLASEIGRAHV